MSAIKAIRKDEDNTFTRFMAVFDDWKRSSCKPYTWKTLVNALRSRSVGEIRLADELDREFC